MPKIGYFTRAMNDYPNLKYLVLGCMAIMILTAKDP
jgi:hypothetical protein